MLQTEKNNAKSSQDKNLNADTVRSVDKQLSDSEASKSSAKAKPHADKSDKKQASKPKKTNKTASKTMEHRYLAPIEDKDNANIKLSDKTNKAPLKKQKAEADGGLEAETKLENVSEFIKLTGEDVQAKWQASNPALQNDDNGSDKPEEREEFLKGTLIARNLVKKYRNRSVVSGVSFGVRAGEAVGILGPNGAGKTTCFYMVTGLVPADSGNIEIDGYDVTSMAMYRRARLGVGYLPQEASIFRGLSVEDNILAALEVVEKDKKQRQRDLDALLEEFKIAHLRKSMAITLSGGERRRLEIARALASRPNFMLLDEPFAGIDPIAIGDIQQLVRHLTERGIGVLITDHNVRETLGLVDRAYIIHAGQVLTHGTPNEIVANADVRRFYLGDTFSL